MKKLALLMIIWAISLLVSGCMSSPQPERVPMPSVREQVQELKHTAVSPIELPEKFKVAVKPFVDENGKKWILVDPNDLDRVKAAYISAEGNAKLVGEMNDYTRLVVERANMMRELAIMEEYRSSRLEIRIEEEREAADIRAQRDGMDIWLWRVTTILALAVGL